MIGSPVTLKDGDKTWSLTPDQITAYMDFTSENQNGVSTLVPYHLGREDGALLRQHRRPRWRQNRWTPRSTATERRPGSSQGS